MLPHSVVIDKNDRVYVGDRENARIQIFDTDGRFLAQWTGIGYPYGLCITPDQHVWMVDGGFDRIVELDQAGKILGSIGSPGHQPGQVAWGHFLAIASDRKLFVADVLNWRFQVFVPAKASGKLSEYVPTERQFYGFKQSDGYFFRSPGWPTK
jgi:DNA-binding beta-propeller fold protein YncE